MKSTERVTPTISVILPGMFGWKTVRPALEFWEAQTCRLQLEIILLAPDAQQAADSLPPGTIAIPTGSLRLHEARALGIRSASAPYILMAEDHCVPDPDYTEAILECIAEGWDVVAPVLRPFNGETTVAQSSFLLGYGQWLEPVASGPTDVVPGHNVAIRRAPLLELGPALEEELLMCSFLLRRLRQQGARFYLENRSRMRHFDPAQLGKTLVIMGIVGLGFGAVRTKHWSWPARVLYPLAVLAVAGRHWMRAAVQYGRAGSQAGLSPLCLPLAVPLATAWACGEALGALVGPARVAPHLWRCEVKPLTQCGNLAGDSGE